MPRCRSPGSQKLHRPERYRAKRRYSAVRHRPAGVPGLSEPIRSRRFHPAALPPVPPLPSVPPLPPTPPTPPPPVLAESGQAMTPTATRQDSPRPRLSPPDQRKGRRPQSPGRRDGRIHDHRERLHLRLPARGPAQPGRSSPQVDSRLAVLAAVERGEIDIDEAMRRLDRAPTKLAQALSRSPSPGPSMAQVNRPARPPLNPFTGHSVVRDQGGSTCTTATIELQAIANARQEDLRNERYCTASTRATPRIFASMRRNVGLALISAGEAIADRRPSRPIATLQTAPTASTSRLAS